jgi:hypothetical protein
MQAAELGSNFLGTWVTQLQGSGLRVWRDFQQHPWETVAWKPQGVRKWVKWTPPNPTCSNPKFRELLPMVPVCSVIYCIPVFLNTNKSRGTLESGWRFDCGRPRVVDAIDYINLIYRFLIRLFPLSLCNIRILSRFYKSASDTTGVTVVFDRSMAGYGTVPTVPSSQNARAALLCNLVRSICDASAQID